MSVSFGTSCSASMMRLFAMFQLAILTSLRDSQSHLLFSFWILEITSTKFSSRKRGQSTISLNFSMVAVVRFQPKTGTLPMQMREGPGSSCQSSIGHSFLR